MSASDPKPDAAQKLPSLIRIVARLAGFLHLEPDPAVAVLDGILEGREQGLIFGEIIGLPAKILAQLRDALALFILNDHAVGGRARIAARAAIDVCD